MWEHVFRCFCTHSTKPPRLDDTTTVGCHTVNLHESLTPAIADYCSAYGMIYLPGDAARGGAMCTRHDRGSSAQSPDLGWTYSTRSCAWTNRPLFVVAQTILVMWYLFDDFYPRFGLLTRGCFRTDRLNSRVRSRKRQNASEPQTTVEIKNKNILKKNVPWKSSGTEKNDFAVVLQYRLIVNWAVRFLTDFGLIPISRPVRHYSFMQCL